MIIVRNILFFSARFINVHSCSFPTFFQILRSEFIRAIISHNATVTRAAIRVIGTASELATHIDKPRHRPPPPTTFLSHPRDCLPLDAERKSTTGSAQESSRCNSWPMTASPARRARNATPHGEGLTRANAASSGIYRRGP